MDKRKYSQMPATTLYKFCGLQRNASRQPYIYGPLNRYVSSALKAPALNRQPVDIQSAISTKLKISWELWNFGRQWLPVIATFFLVAGGSATGLH